LTVPNRILKESVCTSDSVDGLSLAAEVFFYRLIVNCDDYGRADARPRVLRSRCFPLRVDVVSDDDIRGWLRELTKAGIVRCYQVDGAPYLVMASWDKHQQIRAKRSKFPAPADEAEQVQEPDSIGNQLQSDASKCPRNPIQSESNPNPKHTTYAADAAPKPADKLPPHTSYFGRVVNLWGEPSNDSIKGTYEKAAKFFRQSGLSLKEIGDLKAEYERRWPDMERTPLALAKNVDIMRQPERPPSKNGRPPVVAPPDLAELKRTGAFS
jgi:hypothetical protein